MPGEFPIFSYTAYWKVFTLGYSQFLHTSVGEFRVDVISFSIRTTFFFHGCHLLEDWSGIVYLLGLLCLSLAGVDIQLVLCRRISRTLGLVLSLSLLSFFCILDESNKPELGLLPVSPVTALGATVTAGMKGSSHLPGGPFFMPCLSPHCACVLYNSWHSL